MDKPYCLDQDDQKNEKIIPPEHPKTEQDKKNQ